MIALSCLLFSFVCLAHSRSYHDGHFNDGSQRDSFCVGKVNRNYRDPDNCHGFIQCSNQITYKQHCNPCSLKYNEKTDQCDWPWNVQCDQGTRCEEGSTSYDECGQRCTCVAGRLVDCVRIRKEFTSLTDAEKKRHIDTILKVSAIDSIHRAEYEQLINEHYELFNGTIHEPKHFLPWHRYYILRYEKLMQKADCTFTATYWDWSLDSRKPFSTGPENVWNSDTGFGGNGVDTDQNCVLDGPFRKGAWKRVRPNNQAWPSTDCLTRAFNGNPPGETRLMVLLASDDFNFFEKILRGEMHDNVHCEIGETMCSQQAASAPEFFLHHAFIDKIWDDWQKKSCAHKDAYFPSIEENMPGTDLRPVQLIDLSNQPGGVSVEYEPYEPEEKIRAKFAGLSLVQLRHQKSRPSTPLSEQAIKLFKISPAEVKKIREFEQGFEPTVTEPKHKH